MCGGALSGRLQEVLSAVIPTIFSGGLVSARVHHPPVPSSQDTFHDGPERSRARPYLARRSEPLPARTVQRGSGMRGKEALNLRNQPEK